jgi:hypothetical protein
MHICPMRSDWLSKRRSGEQGEARGTRPGLIPSRPAWLDQQTCDRAVVTKTRTSETGCIRSPKRERVKGAVYIVENSHSLPLRLTAESRSLHWRKTDKRNEVTTGVALERWSKRSSRCQPHALRWKDCLRSKSLRESRRIRRRRHGLWIVEVSVVERKRAW